MPYRSWWSFKRLALRLSYMSGEPLWDCEAALRRSESLRIQLWGEFQLWLKENPA